MSRNFGYIEREIGEGPDLIILNLAVLTSYVVA